MQALAPSGVGLPAPDCLVTPKDGNSPIPLSRCAGQGLQHLVLLPSVFDHAPLLNMLAEKNAQAIVIAADSPAALKQAALPALAIYSDPTLSFARLYGCSCAPQGCRPALFTLQDGWITQSYLCETVNVDLWCALL